MLFVWVDFRRFNKMANVALLIAGGSGNRMGQSIPKQFLTVNERPVIVYTLNYWKTCIYMAMSKSEEQLAKLI